MNNLYVMFVRALTVLSPVVSTDVRNTRIHATTIGNSNVFDVVLYGSVHVYIHTYSVYLSRNTRNVHNTLHRYGMLNTQTLWFRKSARQRER